MSVYDMKKNKTLLEDVGGTTFVLQQGTCRFGTDPATSVLDVNCRAHEVPNLYVVDGSFTSESSNLPELLSWEQRLQQTKVWPYDMTMYLRIFLYVGIGLSSWIGAALVERFIGAFFG